MLDQVKGALHEAQMASRGRLNQRTIWMHPDTRRAIILQTNEMLGKPLEPPQTGVVERLYGVELRTSTYIKPGEIFVLPTVQGGPITMHTVSLPAFASTTNYISNDTRPEIVTGEGSSAERHLRAIEAEAKQAAAEKRAERYHAEIVRLAFENGDAIRFSRTSDRDGAELWYGVIKSGGAWYSTGRRGINGADDVAFAAWLIELGVDIEDLEVSWVLESTEDGK